MDAATQLLWPACAGPEDLADIERIPLMDRGLPASTDERVRRAAGRRPDRPAVSTLPDAERYEQPSTRTFAELAADVHRVIVVVVGGVTDDEAWAALAPLGISWRAT